MDKHKVKKTKATKDADLATCSRLVVDHVIESMYSKEMEKVTGQNGKPTVPSSLMSPSKPLHLTAAALVSKSQNEVTRMAASMATSDKQKTDKGSLTKVSVTEKMGLTFGQIQETLIRRAVENSYELNLTPEKNKTEPLETSTDFKIKGKTEAAVKEVNKENIKKTPVKSEENDPYAFTDTPPVGDMDYIPKKFRTAKINKENNNNLSDTERPMKTPEKVKSQSGHSSTDSPGKQKKKKKVNHSALPQTIPECTSLEAQSSFSCLGQTHRRPMWSMDSGPAGSESPNASVGDCEVQSCSGESRDEEGDWGDYEDFGVRKSSRSNRGRKYQELIEQGYLQSARDKAAGKKINL